MAPPSVDFLDHEINSIPVNLKNSSPTKSLIRTPLKNSGMLDQYESFDVTAVIGREFPKAQLSEILTDDAKIRDLAITGAFFSRGI